MIDRTTFDLRMERGRHAAGLAATVALGLSLLVGGAFGQGQQAALAAPQVSTDTVAGARPVDASTTVAFRWEFGQDRGTPPLVGASVAAEYRWDFGEQHILPGSGTTAYRLSAPNEHNPDGTGGEAALAPLPADASTTTEYRWAFAPAEAVVTSTPGGYRLSAPNEADPDGSGVIAAPTRQPVDASTSEQFRWAFGPESGTTAPDLAMLPPSLQNISA